jgi:manganese/iron transport system ATP-binding protein
MTSAAVPASLDVNNLTVAYSNGQIALRDATFRLRAPTICGLVGMNGSGKSTLFKAVMGFVRPTWGSVTIMGMPVQRAHKKSLVAYVPQSEDVDWAFPVSVWDVVLMGRYGFMNILRLPSRHDRQRCHEALERVGMHDLRDRQIGELSGGQKKRVFLARALAQEGQVILLDEPFTGVDVQTELAIVTLLKELRDSGRVILVSTHNLGSVPEFCNEVVILNRTVVAAGPVETTFNGDTLAIAFGGALRHVSLESARSGEAAGSTTPLTPLTVLNDDEGALVIGSDGRISRPPRHASTQRTP